MRRSLSQKIFRNTSFIILSRVISLAASLFVIPLIIHDVGTIRYGVWAALFAFVDYFNLLDLGFGAASVKYTAECHAQNNILRIGQIASTATLFHLCLLPLMIAPFLFSENIVSFFNVLPENRAEALFVFKGALIIFFFSQLTGIFRNILTGIQRIDIQNQCMIVNTFLYVLGVILVLKHEYGLRGLILLIGGLRLALSCTYALCVFKMVPQIKEGLMDLESKLFKDFFKYGIRLQITSISGLLNFQLDKLLIGHFLRMEFVAFYELGSKIAMFIRRLPSVFLGALIPASAELSAKRDHKRLEAMHLRGGRYITLVAAPIAFFLSTMAPTIMSIWMGSVDYPYAILALRILAIGYFFNIITGVITSIIRGIGILEYEMNASLSIAFANLILSLILIVKIGFIGALIGTATAMTLGNMFYLYRFNKYLGIGITTFLKETFVWPLTAAFFAAAIIWITQYLIYADYLLIPINRISMLAYFMLACVSYSFLYICGLVAVRFINQSDLEVFTQIIRSVRNA